MTARARGGRLGVVALDLAPGWGGPPQHVHREHDETFFVVQGTVRFTSGADTLLASPGRLVTAPIGNPHTFANADEQAPASLLCSVTPERYLGYFRALAELAAGATSRLDPARVLEVMARYATDPREADSRGPWGRRRGRRAGVGLTRHHVQCQARRAGAARVQKARRCCKVPSTDGPRHPAALSDRTRILIRHLARACWRLWRARWSD